MARYAFFVLVLPLAFGCTAPIDVHRLSPQDAQIAQTANILTSGEPSNISHIVLRQYDLLDMYEERPNEALSALRAIAIAKDGPDNELFALAELSYAYAEDCAGRPYYLAAALYAYALLFPGPDESMLDPIDPRTRIASDIYNRALAEALETQDEEREADLAAGTFELPCSPSARVGPNPAVI